MPIVDGKLKLAPNATALEALLGKITDHAADHGSGGDDELNVLNLAGYSGDTTKFIRADGSLAVPPGVGGVTYGTTAGTSTEGNDARLPTTAEKAALAGSDGTPSGTNTYVTSSDSRLTDARTPDTHTHLLADISDYTGGGEVTVDSTAVPGVTIGKTGSGAAYICTGTNDNLIWDQAFDESASGSTIYILPGVYIFGTGSGKSGKNFDIIGLGDVEIRGACNPQLYFSGTTITTQALSAGSNAGTKTITLASASSVLAGDIIRLYNSDVWSATDYPSLKTGETYLVDSVSGNDVTLTEPLLRTYTTAKSSTAIVYRPARINIKNIKCKGSSNTGNYAGIQLHRCRDSSVENCRFEDNGYCAVAFRSCYNVSASNNTVQDGNRAGEGYGIAFYDGTAHIRIEDNYIENCRHCITSGLDDGYNLNRGAIINHNTVVGSAITDSNVIDSHPGSIDYTVTNNTIHTYSTYAAFYDACLHSVFSNNTVYGNGVLRRGSVAGGSHVVSGNHVYGGYIYKGNNSAINKLISITGNTSEGGTYGVRIITETFENYSIVGNTVKNCTGNAFELTLPGATTAIMSISGNNVYTAAGNGIAVTRDNSGGELVLNINGNIIKSVVGHGIAMNSIYGAVICANTIVDVSGSGYGIREVTGATACNYNNVCNNNVHGCSTAISAPGSNTVRVNNLTIP